MKIKPGLFFIFTVLLLAASCNQAKSQTLRKIDIQLSGKVIQAEIARTPQEREKGLMFRTALGENEGMLFIFPKESIRSFWMKNTLIPLDVGYFDAQGFFIEAKTMLPDDGEKTHVSSEPALYALEMNAGWFKKNNIRKYDRLVITETIRGE